MPLQRVVLRPDPFARRAAAGFASAGAATTIPGLSSGAMYDPDRESVVQATERFWLRPYPTFEHLGPLIPSGSPLVVEAFTPHVQGNLRLWRVRGTASGTAGYAAFTEDDTGTTGFQSRPEWPWHDVPADNTPLRGGTSPANTSRPTTTPAVPPPPALRRVTDSSGKQLLVFLGIAGAGAFGVYLYRQSQRRGKRG